MAISINILDGFVNKSDKIIVALSGGADSMCLLHLLSAKQKQADFELVALHVNHNIRDKEAERDALFCENYCKKNNIKFVLRNVKVLEKAKTENKSIESLARELRYAVFAEEFEKLNATKIAVAHHKSDQAETILMHIARGSSLKGAKGMQKISGNIIRPLLDFSREEVLEYNKQNGVEFVTDSTNSDLNYTRNFIRGAIIPALKEVYPNIESSLCDFARRCQVDDEFISSLVPTSLIKQGKTEVKVLQQAETLPIPVLYRIFSKALEMLNVFSDIEEKHLCAIKDLFILKTGSVVCLPNKLYAIKDADGISFSFKKKKENKSEVLFKLGETEFKGFGKIYAIDISGKQTPEFGDGNLYVDFEKVPFSAVWRTRREGDMFAKLGTGSKKLNDYFTDKKVPNRLRDSIPVLAVKNRILVVANMDISEQVKITSATEQIVKLICSVDKT